MSRLDALLTRVEASPLGRRLNRLGAFSPLATLRTFSPGARALLAATEATAERGLHVARGLTVLVLVGVQLGPLSGAGTLPLWAPPLLLTAIAALWLLVWRLLSRPRPPAGLKYGLILVDTYAAVRGAVVVQAGAAELVAPLVRVADLNAMAGPMLVLVALSGCFRLDPRAAAFSTVAALVGWTYVATVLELPRGEAIAVGAVVWLAGVIGANAARLFRYMALKAAEEAVLERYVPEALTRELARSGDPNQAGREVDITVLIVDIRGYTARAERLTPAGAVAFLNDYFAIVVAPLAARGAVLDKYIGDGVFTFFEGPEHQRRALTAAREILAAVDRHNLASPAGEPLRIGIALHCGPALVGTIGSVHKREYTAIADVVNVTSRLEELNKRFGSRVVASESVIDAAAPEQVDDFLGPEVTDIRGHHAAVRVRYLPAVNPADAPAATGPSR